MSQTALVFVAALLTALATGLGALPLYSSRMRDTRFLGPSNGIASGVMLGASLSLLIEGAERGLVRTAVGALGGVAALVVTRRLLRRVQAPEIGQLSGADARKGILIVAVMTVHSFAEGIGVGASFGGGESLGIVIAVAIAIHNIPEGFAISLVLVPRGASVRSAAGWSIFSSLPQPLLAVPAFLFVDTFGAALPVGLGFAAGAMIWMVATELLPEAAARTSTIGVVGATGVAFLAMFAFQTVLIHS